MELKDLIGLHELSGVDTTIEGDAEVVRFVLDGKTYKATEDPNDGYRSYLKELEVTDEVTSNNFPPQKVLGKMKGDDTHLVHDIIQFIDVITSKIVLEVGTDESDSYYPYCVLYWSPENLACNINR